MMNETLNMDALLMALVGIAVVLSVIGKSMLHRLGIPALVAYLFLGFLLRLADTYWDFMTETVWNAFRFLADLGIVALMFKVGLSSNPSALADKLPQAVPVWISNVILSGAAGFAAAYWLLDVPLIPSLFIATALTATSVGVSVAPWEESHAMDTPHGQLLLDVAELDDISAVALMALLFAMTPALLTGNGNPWNAAIEAGIVFVIKFTLFLFLCLLFARHLEPMLSLWGRRLRQPPQRMLVVIAFGLLIAALAEWLGLSLAIGALFAGLLFSRDPEAVKTEKSFEDMHAFLTPFFFIGIGLHVVPASLTQALWVGVVLLCAAILGKLVGTALPALWSLGGAGAMLIGTSMIPRAEIAMVILHQGQLLGPDALPDSVYAGMVVVSAMTCLLAPIALQALLRRWPQAVRGQP